MKIPSTACLGKFCSWSCPFIGGWVGWGKQSLSRQATPSSSHVNPIEAGKTTASEASHHRKGQLPCSCLPRLHGAHIT